MNKDLFAGYKKDNDVMTKITLLLSCDDITNRETEEDVVRNCYSKLLKPEDVVNDCYHKLLKVTSLQYLIQDRKKTRTKDGFVGYANLVDLIQREGVKNTTTETEANKLLTCCKLMIPIKCQ
eukprot:TRINITY_DN1889_c0_g1_i1.p1 TRINITY_DN1889_c0_g1~~TRINITY_DN1889_c0_g1_i1.p1  ORF type:complete len:122 (-),score=9.68 TRINITY_DN1889_c0_g1_i1:700-1065(-)